MKIHSLSRFLEQTGELLSDVAGSRASKEWQRLCLALRPFADKTVVEFCDLLLKAEEFQRTGIVGSSKRRSAKPLNPERIKEFAQHILSLQERSVEPNIDYPDIENEIEKLLGPRTVTKAETIAVAQEINIQKRITSKKDAIAEIKKRIVRRKEGVERAGFWNS